MNGSSVTPLSGNTASMAPAFSVVQTDRKAASLVAEIVLLDLLNDLIVNVVVVGMAINTDDRTVCFIYDRFHEVVVEVIRI